MGKEYTKFLLFAFFMVVNFSVSQEGSDIAEPNQMPIIKLDLDTGILSSSFPFDRFFKLEISTKKYQLKEQVSIFNVQYENVKYLKHIGKVDDKNKFIYEEKTVRQLHPSSRAKSWKNAEIVLENFCEDCDFDELIKRKKDSILSDPYSENPIVNTISNVETRIQFKTKRLESKSVNARATSIDKNNYQIIMKPLKPGELYEVVLRKKPSDLELNSLYKIIDLIDSTKRCEAKKLYDSKILSLESSANRLSVPKFLKNYVGFEKNYLNHLKDTIRNNENDLENSFQIKVLEPLRDTVKVIGQKLLLNKLNVEAFSKTYNDFLNLDSVELKEICLGQRKFGNDTVVEIYDRTNRLKNLKNNLAIIDIAKIELQKLFVIDTSPIVLDFIEKDFLKRRELIKENTKTMNELYEGASSYVKSNFYYSNLVSASTIDEDIKTRNARVIVTDFGITGSFAHNNMGEIKFIPRPFTGINLHFGGGIDKDQKLNHIIKKRFWHRYSIAIGVTIGKIDESGFSDFFNGLSPMIGMNYRLQEQIRLGAGVLWLREQNANPLILKKPIEPAAYISLSFDFNLFEQIGKLATKVIN